MGGHGAHDGELSELFWLHLGVGARVEDERGSPGCGEDGGDGRTGDTSDPADDYRGGRHRRPGGAGGYESVSVTRGDEPRRHGYRCVRLLPDCSARIIGHADDVGCVDYRKSRFVLGELVFEEPLITNQHHIDASGRGGDGAGHCL
jgi:hypothetical protein